ncbi:MAG: SGNH/GDSL hydrolase family protein [bacterium]
MRKMLLSVIMLLVNAWVPFISFGDPPVLERIEWSDTWVVNANNQDLPRVLLVGDSIVKGYYGVVESALSGKANCARFATSAFMGNPDYLSELEVLLKRYTFRVIHINNGLHGWGYSEEEYEKRLLPLMALLKKHGKGAVLIWATTTPVRKSADLTHFSEKIARVKERNRIAAEFMINNGIEINDLCSLVEDHPEFHVADGVHFNSEGNAILGECVVKVISKHFAERGGCR